MDPRLELAEMDDLLQACAIAQQNTDEAVQANQMLMHKLMDKDFFTMPNAERMGEGIERFLHTGHEHMELLWQLSHRLQELRELLFAAITTPIQIPLDEN